MCKCQLNVLRIFTCILTLAITIFTFVGCGQQKAETYMIPIDSLEWQATAEIQEWKACEESGWKVPEGATVYKEQEEIKEYKIIGYKTKYRTKEYQEHIGYYLPTWRPRYDTRTKKVAYKEPIKDPVYATKYYYTIDKWVHLKNVRLASGTTHNYDCPEYDVAENEREGDIDYKYLVNFTFEGKEVSYTIQKRLWESLQVGQKIPVTKNGMYGVHVDWIALQYKNS